MLDGLQVVVSNKTLSENFRGRGVLGLFGILSSPLQCLAWFCCVADPDPFDTDPSPTV